MRPQPLISIVADIETIIEAYVHTANPEQEELLGACYEHRLKQLETQASKGVYAYYQRLYNEVIVPTLPQKRV